MQWRATCKGTSDGREGIIVRAQDNAELKFGRTEYKLHHNRLWQNKTEVIPCHFMQKCTAMRIQRCKRIHMCWMKHVHVHLCTKKVKDSMHTMHYQNVIYGQQWNLWICSCDESFNIARQNVDCTLAVVAESFVVSSNELRRNVWENFLCAQACT